MSDETSSRGRILKNSRDAVLIAAISVAALGGIELGLRVAFPSRIVEVPPYEEPAFSFHPGYLVALRPSVSKMFVRLPENGGDTVVWRTNSDGYRGPELRQGQHPRIVVYGDSNIQARFSTRAASFVGQLERRVSELGGEQVEVINAGVVGFGPDQSLLRLEEEIGALEPDLVVFHVFAGNDFGDVIRNRLVELGDHGELRYTSHARVLDPLLERRRIDHWRRRVNAWLVVRAARRLQRPAVDTVATEVTLDPNQSVQSLRSVTAAEFEVYRDGRAQEFGHFADHYDVDLATDTSAESSRAKRRLMEAVLGRVAELTRSHDAGLVVVLQPASLDVAPRNFGLDVSEIQREPGYAPSNLTRVLEEMCAGLGITCVGLFDPFMNSDPASLYFTRDNHWNDRGQALAADLVAPVVLDGLRSR